jgi:hypothetical protein
LLQCGSTGRCCWSRASGGLRLAPRVWISSETLPEARVHTRTGSLGTVASGRTVASGAYLHLVSSLCPLCLYAACPALRCPALPCAALRCRAVPCRAVPCPVRRCRSEFASRAACMAHSPSESAPPLSLPPVCGSPACGVTITVLTSLAACRAILCVHHEVAVREEERAYREKDGPDHPDL